jgi:hypothetical protein
VNLGLWIALAAVVVAIIGIAATVFAARRWGNRRRRILFSCEAAPLLPIADENHLLEVTYRDFPVKDPHLVTVRIANIGSSDIASQHFDAGRSLIVDLNCTMFGVTSTSQPRYTVSGAIGSEGVLELRPLLLHRGEEWVVEAVVSGEVNAVLDCPLIDTDVVEGAPALKQLAQQLAEIAVSVSLPFGAQIQLKR